MLNISHLTHADGVTICLLFDDGHGDCAKSYEKGYDDFDYADYSTDSQDDNFLTSKKKKKRSEKEIIEDILNRWN